MNKRRFTPWVVLVCMSALAACTSGEGGTAGNTELNVLVPPAGTGSPGPIANVQSVEYTINCLGNDDTFLDNDQSFPDEVQINGNLEVQDGRTNPSADYVDPFPGVDVDGQAEVWQAFMDLPPGDCTVQLRARDGIGPNSEIICTTQPETITIVADTTVKINLVLICDASFQAPVGMLDVDATFSFVVGNFCPDLFVLSCLQSDEIQPLGPPIPFPLEATECEVRSRDGDNTCGTACDPQICQVVPEGLVCTQPGGPPLPNGTDPGPFPLLTTTVTCTGAGVDGAQTNAIDCDGFPTTTETQCQWQTTPGAPLLGSVGQEPYIPFGLLAALGGGPPPPPGTFFVNCSGNTLLGGSVPPLDPGATITCTATLSDGDEDCDKTKVFTTKCLGNTPCEEFAINQGATSGDAACEALNPTICAVSTCDDANCDPATGAGCCVDTPDMTGVDCSSELPAGSGICGGPGNTTPGVCGATACADDAACDDSNPCTATLSCDEVGQCSGGSNDGAACSDATDCPGGTCLNAGPLGSGFCCLDANTAGCTADETAGNLSGGTLCDVRECSSNGSACITANDCPTGDTCGSLGADTGVCDGAGTCNAEVCTVADQAVDCPAVTDCATTGCAVATCLGGDNEGADCSADPAVCTGGGTCAPFEGECFSNNVANAACVGGDNVGADCSADPAVCTGGGTCEGATSCSTCVDGTEAGTECFDAAAATACTAGGGTCQTSECVDGGCAGQAPDLPAATFPIPNVCVVGGAGNGAIVQLDLAITMDPGPIQTGNDVDVEFVNVVADISQAFLQGAMFAVPSLEVAIIQAGTQATVGVATGGTGPDQAACPGCTVPGTVVVPLDSSDGAPVNTSGTYNCYETNTAAGETTFTTTPPTLLGTKPCGTSCGGGPTTCAALDPDGPGPLGAFPLVIAPSQLSITPAPGTIATYSVTGAGGMDELCFETVGSGITTDTFLDVAIIPGILEAPIFCGPGILNPDDSTTPLTDVNRLCFEITP